MLELLERGQAQVILISNDRAAFGEKKGMRRLAPDLLAELSESSHAGRVKLYFQLADFTAELPEAVELAASWQQVLTGDADTARQLTDYLVKIAGADAAHVIGAENLPGNVRNARFVSFTNPRDLHVNEARVAPDGGSTLLDVVLTADYRQEFEARLPDPAAPPGIFRWVEMTAESSIFLSFEVVQRAEEPSEFAGRLVGWSDPRDDRQPFFPPGEDD